MTNKRKIISSNPRLSLNFRCFLQGIATQIPQIGHPHASSDTQTQTLTITYTPTKTVREYEQHKEKQKINKGYARRCAILR